VQLSSSLAVTVTPVSRDVNAVRPYFSGAPGAPALVGLGGAASALLVAEDKGKSAGHVWDIAGDLGHKYVVHI
jgi:hypothetical protein